MKKYNIVFSMMHIMPTVVGEKEKVVISFPLPKGVSFEDLKSIDKGNSSLPLYLKLNEGIVEVWSPPNNSVGGVFVVEENK